MAKPTPQNPLVLSNQAMLKLGLKKQPFTETILSADALFSDSIFEQFVETLKHHLQFSDLFLIVEGDLGSGKTTLYRRLIQDEIANLYLLPLQAEATDTIVQLQQKISIHLKEQGNANYIDDNLKHLQVFDQKPVVIIDDAHVLSDTTIQELLRYQKKLESEKEVKIKILLFANRGMAQTLEQITDLQHNQLYVQDMPALTSKQINAFINHKLLHAGYHEPSFLSDEQLKTIAAKSKGLPIDAMKLAVTEIEKWVKHQSKKPLKVKLSKPAIIALVILVVIAGSGGIFFALQSFMNDQLADISSPVPTTITTQDTNISAPVSPPVNNEPEPDTGVTTEALVEAPTIIATDIPSDTNTVTELQEREAPVDLALTTPESETSIAIQEPSPALMLPEPKTPAMPVIAPSPAKPAKPAEPAPPPAPVQAEKPKIVLAKQVSHPGHPALEKLRQLGIKDPAWLRAQNPAHWTLQILGARDPQTLVNFIGQFKLNTDDTAWYVTDLKGKPWYVLLYRFYTDQDVARQSITRLPTEVQQGHPWVKSLDAVQKAMKP